MGSIGFMSNLSFEKGLFEFLDLAAELQRRGLPVKALLAGPFEDAETEERARASLRRADNVEYVGPKYGEAKAASLSAIDAFIFPTRYRTRRSRLSSSRP